MGSVRAMNQRLAVAFTGRSLQAIKGVRRASNLRYSGFLTAAGANAGGATQPQGQPYVSPSRVDETVNDAIAAGIARRPRRVTVPEGRTRPVAVDLPASLDSPAHPAAAPEDAGIDCGAVEPAAGEDRPAEAPQDPEGVVHWFEQLWGQVRDIDLKLPRPRAAPGALTDDIRSWIDREYALWAPAAELRNSRHRPVTRGDNSDENNIVEYNVCTINFEATDYIDVIESSGLSLTEPPVTMDISRARSQTIDGDWGCTLTGLTFVIHKDADVIIIGTYTTAIRPAFLHKDPYLFCVQ